MRKKITLLVLSIVLMLTIIISSTYSVIFKVNETEKQSFETGTLLVTSDATNNSVTLTNALPMEDSAGETSTPYTFKITNTGNLNFNFDVKFLSTTTENMISPQYIKIKINDNPTTTLDQLTEGIIISNQTLNPGKSLDVTLRVWLAGNTPNTEIGKVFNAKVTTEGQAVYTEEPVLVNVPNLINNSLIPIYYDESCNSNQGCWKKADENNINGSWYNYAEKRWANAVLVTSENRGTYKDAIAGTPITETDILAYYVWIPRYKYKVWNINKEVGTDTYDAYTKGIDIVFEVEDATTGTITCDSYSYAAPVATKGQPNETCSDKGTSGYYTHPAFTFGNDELSGFWIGKFELSSTDQIAENYGGKDRIDLTPRILPDVMSWRYNTVGNFWKVIYDMQTTDNIYGLPTDRTTVDSHMLTNMEWGAVAYLTHSKYGRCTGGENSTCTEVAKNNSGEDSYKTNYTGRSSGVGGSDGYTAAGTYTYKEEGGQLASTTGNIYGVYDMSGGAYEYVMGNIGTSAGQTSGEYKYYASNAGSNYAYAGFEKYLTPYTYGTTNTDQTAYNRGRLGDATSEVVRSTGGSGGWYRDYAYFPYSSNSWFMRGGYFNNSSLAGPFSFSYYYGGSSSDDSARASLVLVAS